MCVTAHAVTQEIHSQQKGQHNFEKKITCNKKDYLNLVTEVKLQIRLPGLKLLGQLILSYVSVVAASKVLAALKLPVH